MRLIALLVVAFGIALAGGSLYYANKFLDERVSAIQGGPDTVSILVAKQRLSKGNILAAEHLQWVEWPRASIPDGAFASTEALFGKDHKDRRYVARTIDPGEPILDSKISAPNKLSRPTDELQDGYRLVSFRVDEVAIVSGFVNVGDRVDIQLTHSPEGQLISSIILQGIEIKAIDQIIDPERNRPQVGQTVTVEVTLRQAQILALAQQRGRLSLILRRQDEEIEGEKPSPLTTEELNDLLKPPEKKKPTVRLRKGTDDVQDVEVR